MSWRRRRTRTWVSRLLRAECDRKLAAGRSLEPGDNATPVGRLSGGHWGLQPKNHFATSNGDAPWAVFHGLRRYDGFRVGRREPVWAAVRKGSRRRRHRGGRHVTVGRCGGDGEFEQCANLLLESAHGLQDVAGKPNAGD